jgi:hypothetical protein
MSSFCKSRHTRKKHYRKQQRSFHSASRNPLYQNKKGGIAALCKVLLMIVAAARAA